MTHTQEKKKSKRRLLPVILCGILMFLAFLCFFSARWYVNTYGRLGFDAVINTLTGGLGGVQSGLIVQYLLKSLLPTLLCTALGVLALSLIPGKIRWKGTRIVTILICVVLSIGLIIFAAFDVELVDYIIHQWNTGNLYEKYYVNPDDVQITFPKEKRNLIYIFLESMELSYLSEELGGAMEENLIPELYALAQENTCFSNSTADVGGFYPVSGATWTIGALVSQTAGISLKTPSGKQNDYGSDGEEFLPGVTSLTNILADAGYYQTLMVGSDANFGGRKPYFVQHGVDNVYDIYTARKDGIVDSNYWVWWGMEDMYLFEYAKQELTEISQRDQPFAFTMLTVDTHHIGGYQCELCEASTSGETYDQSISCSSRQVASFVEWIQAQDFYENTTIVIVGDHLSMDNDYFERKVDEDYQRLVYNCIINATAYTEHTANRTFCGMDLFPTTLAAIGCDIDGDRIGLGTNLFSDLPTLAEEMGLNKFNTELAKASDYYSENFYSQEPE